MTDATQAARDDLAFLKAVTEDRGPLPAPFGAHLLAIGLIFGADFVWIWALFAGLAPRLPNDPWMLVTWLPATMLYVPVNLRIGRRHPVVVGPTARMFIAAWGAMATMMWASLVAVITASVRHDVPYYEIWPSFAFVLYGGAWSVVGFIRRNRWYGFVATGCFTVAVASAILIGHPEAWLVMSGGFFAFLAFPGALIVRDARMPG